MQVMYERCAGLDVHKKTVMACRVRPDPTGQRADGLVELQDDLGVEVEAVPGVPAEFAAGHRGTPSQLVHCAPTR